MHKLFNETDILNYVKTEVDLGFSKDLSVSKLEKGRVNHIYRISDNTCRRSVIFKQSDKQATRINSTVLGAVDLPLERNNNEVQALSLINSINPAFAPVVLNNNKENYFFIMEDLVGFDDVRDTLLAGTVVPGFCSEITRIMISIFNESNKHLANFGRNYCMKEILYALLFQIPFSKNVILSNKALVDCNYFLQMFQKIDIQNHISTASGLLFNKPQVLLNGDLHFGSICHKDNQYKFYDYEFAFFGPMGYDAGKVLAHLILAYVYQNYRNLKSNCEILCAEIETYFNSFIEAYPSSDIGSHICIFCGIELISRVTGILQLQYILGINEMEYRDQVQKSILDIAIKFLENDKLIENGEELLGYVKGI